MRKILIIEDDIHLTDLYQAKFTIEGFTVIAAGDGGLGIDAAVAQQPNVILLDILMPNVNGFEVLKELKTKSETKDIPVVVYTNLGSSDSDEKRELAFSLGAADYLVKALHEPDAIVARINQLVKPEGAKTSTDSMLRDDQPKGEAQNSTITDTASDEGENIPLKKAA